MALRKYEMIRDARSMNKTDKSVDWHIGRRGSQFDYISPNPANRKLQIKYDEIINPYEKQALTNAKNDMDIMYRREFELRKMMRNP